MSKSQFEHEAAHCGVNVDHSHTDNGIFTKSQFCSAPLSVNQGHTILGVGTHHQNGLVERAIKTIQDMTHAMMLHLSIHWPDEYDIQLWPFAMDYAVWLYNHTPQHDSGMAPMELFCGTCLNCEYLPLLCQGVWLSNLHLGPKTSGWYQNSQVEPSHLPWPVFGFFAPPLFLHWPYLQFANQLPHATIPCGLRPTVFHCGW